MKPFCKAVWMFLLVVPAALQADTSKPTYPPPAEVKAAFLKQLDRPRVAPDVKVQEQTTEKDGLVVERLSFASEKKADGKVERVPVLLIKPAGKQDGKLPAVLVLHGTGGSKENEQDLLRKLARKGMIGVAIDGRYHGERANGAQGATAYNEAIVRAWEAKPGEPQEHPLYFDTCWDVWRTIDYLTSRDDVDAGRLGLMGISKGGIETWLAGAVDDRVKVAVPAISVQSFRWSLDHERWQGRAQTIAAAHAAAARDLGEAKVNARVCRALWNKVIPGMLDQFDCPSMLRLLAGRPLLILSGELDPNCPLGGAQLAFASAEEAYKKAHAEDRLKVMLAKGVGHSVTPEQREAAVAWFEKWFKEGGGSAK